MLVWFGWYEYLGGGGGGEGTVRETEQFWEVSGAMSVGQRASGLFLFLFELVSKVLYPYAYQLMY